MRTHKCMVSKATNAYMLISTENIDDENSKNKQARSHVGGVGEWRRRVSIGEWVQASVNKASERRG